MKKYISFILFLLVSLVTFSSASAHRGTANVKNDNFFEGHSFFELWNPHIAFIVILIFVFYLEGIKFVSQKNGVNVYILKKLSFLTGLVVFYIALGSPLHILGDSYLFSVHMFNQSLVYILLPPLILYGIPEVLVRPFVQKIIKVKVISFLLKPLLSLLLFNVLFSFYHIPVLFDTIVTNTFLHNITHSILGIAAFLMWVQVLPITKELDQISPLLKIGYLFGAGILLTPACALILFSDSLFYESYSTYSLGNLTPLQDQKAGGIVMKIFQEFVYVPVMGYIFHHWRNKERVYEIDDIPIYKEEVNV